MIMYPCLTHSCLCATWFFMLGHLAHPIVKQKILRKHEIHFRVKDSCKTQRAKISRASNADLDTALHDLSHFTVLYGHRAISFLTKSAHICQQAFASEAVSSTLKLLPSYQTPPAPPHPPQFSGMAQECVSHCPRKDSPPEQLYRPASSFAKSAKPYLRLMSIYLKQPNNLQMPNIPTIKTNRTVLTAIQIEFPNVNIFFVLFFLNFQYVQVSLRGAIGIQQGELGRPKVQQRLGRTFTAQTHRQMGDVRLDPRPPTFWREVGESW